MTKLVAEIKYRVEDFTALYAEADKLKALLATDPRYTRVVVKVLKA